MSAQEKSQLFIKQIEEKEALLKIMRSRMVEIAFDLIGSKAMRYKEPDQGMSEEGFDCSGFVSTVVKRAADEQGVSLPIPRHANEQWRTFGEPVHYPRRQAGDLVFFPSRKKRNMLIVGHVGLVVSSGEYIHSPGKDGTMVGLASLPAEQQEIPGSLPEDIYTHSPLGIKRTSLPVGSGRWQVH